MFKKLLLSAFAILALTACNDDNDDALRFAQQNVKIENGSLTGSNLRFLGAATATSADGEVYTDTQARFEFAGGSGKFALYMHKTRFAAAMPPLEMRISSMPYAPGTGASLTFTAPSVVPEVSLPNETGGGYSYRPLPSYTLTEVDGSINGIECRVGFSCNVPKLGAYRVEYEGKLLE